MNSSSAFPAFGVMQIFGLAIMIYLYQRTRDLRNIFVGIGWVFWFLSNLYIGSGGYSVTNFAFIYFVTLGTYHLILGGVIDLFDLSLKKMYLGSIILASTGGLLYFIDSNISSIFLLITNLLLIQSIPYLLVVKQYISDKNLGSSRFWILIVYIFTMLHVALNIVIPTYYISSFSFAVNTVIILSVLVYFITLQEYILFSRYKDMTQQNIELQKYELLNQFTGGIAHNFNNILTIIRGSTEICQILNTNPDLEEQLSHILDATQRASKLVNHTLNMSSSHLREPKIINPNSSVTSLIDLFNSITKSNILVGIDLRSSFLIKADEDQIEQVLLNLLSNARDAVNEVKTSPKKIIVRTSNFDNISGDNKKLAKKQYVKIDVIDNGIGIRDEQRSMLFNPFFTTKDTGRGLGLSTIYNILQQNNAHIFVESEYNAGSTFTIFWPVSYEEASDEPVNDDLSAKNNERARILLLEDEQNLRDILDKVLTRLGYHVTEAEDGQKGLELFASNDFDLIITDILMPKLDGISFYRQIENKLGNTPVIFISGYYGAEIENLDEILSSNPKTQFLKKPFKYSELASAIIDLLQNSG